MSARRPLLSEPTLVGQRVELRPLRSEDEKALLAAAADGELWNLEVTVVPGPLTIADYVDKALAGRQDATVMPFVIVQRETGRVVGKHSILEDR